MAPNPSLRGERARSPIERGVLMGETRVLDTCFGFSPNGFTVSGSTTSVTPLARLVVDRHAIDIGGVVAEASKARATVRERALETATRWNLLEDRLAVLLANQRRIPTKRLDFSDGDLLDLVLERWGKLRPADPRNLRLEDAQKVLGLVELPIAGLLSDRSVPELAEQTLALGEAYRLLGSRIESPEMIFSFLSLGVIPALRLTNRGLVDAVAFELVSPVVANS